MKFRARLHNLIATGVPAMGTLLSSGQAHAQVEYAKPLIDTVSRSENIAIVVLVLVVLALFGYIYIVTTRHDRERERHEAALNQALNRFLESIEKSSKATEGQAIAQERLRDAIADVGEGVTEVISELRGAITRNDANQMEIRAAATESRDALRATRGAGR